MNNKELGTFGEVQAQKFLKRRGYKIVETNFRVKSAEVDIIAYDKKVLCFIEVKTRTSDLFGMPSSAVDYKKQQKIMTGAQFYIMNNDIQCEIRFDIAEVFAYEKNGRLKLEKINLIKNAFEG